MTTLTIAPVVEGDGEVQAIHILIRRICQEIFGVYDCSVRKPWRLPRSKMGKPHEMKRTVTVAAQGLPGPGGILVVLDQDDDTCVVELAQSLSESYEVNCPVEVVVASREYESWFLAGVESLREHRSVRSDATYTRSAEARRNAKKELELLMTESYRETIHQPAFTGLLDLHASRENSRSFSRMISAVGKLVQEK